jgi:hypothetical protein
LATGAGLEVIDISTPETPRVLGGYKTVGNVSDIAVSGNFAYIIADNAAVHFIDICVPENPRWVGSYKPDPMAVTTVAVSGNYAYVGVTGGWVPLADTSLDVVDITDPANSRRVARCNLNSCLTSWNRIEISGTHAYFAYGGDCLTYDGGGGFGRLIIDIGEPTNPRSLGTWFVSVLRSWMAFSGTYAYLVDRFRFGVPYVEVLDISDSANPRSLGRSQTEPIPRAVVASANWAYVADDGVWNGTNLTGAGLQVFLVHPANPQRIISYNGSGPALDVAVSDHYVFVAGGGGGLKTLDISNPASPQGLSDYDMGGNAQGVAVLDKYAYLVGRSERTLITVVLFTSLT